MNYHYCQVCFKKTPQTTDIIKFCAHCGKSFSEPENLSISTTNNSTKFICLPSKTFKDKARERLESKSRRQSVEEDGDEINDLLDDDIESDYGAQMPNINKLDLEVDLSPDQGVSISNIARGAKRDARIDNTKKVKINKKKFLEQYKKEASAIRNK